jgi:hypothetical protein
VTDDAPLRQQQAADAPPDQRLKRRQYRAVLKALDALRDGAAYLPYEAQRLLLDGLAGIESAHGVLVRWRRKA